VGHTSVLVTGSLKVNKLNIHSTEDIHVEEEIVVSKKILFLLNLIELHRRKILDVTNLLLKLGAMENPSHCGDFENYY
jgi:hypothetical protein